MPVVLEWFEIIVATAINSAAATRIPIPSPISSTSQQIMIGITAMVAAMVSKPNMWMVQALNGSTAPRNKSGMPMTCITLFRGSR